MMWRSAFMLAWGIAFALVNAEDVDISRLLLANPDSLSTDSGLRATELPLSSSSEIFSSSSVRPALIRNTHTGVTSPDDTPPRSGMPIVLGLLGGPGGAWFDLGVLASVEAYHIPLDRIVGAGWGAWMGAVWAEGYSTLQIREWLLSADSLAPEWVWGSQDGEGNATSILPLQNAVTRSGVPALSMSWSLVHQSSALPSLQPTNSPSGSLLARTSLANLLLQQPLLSRIQQGNAVNLKPARLPWNALLCDESVAQITLSADRPAVEWVFASMGIHPTQVGNAHLSPMEHCGVVDFDSLDKRWPKQQWILSSSWPERNLGLTDPQTRLALAEVQSQSAHSALWIRPHWVDSTRQRNAQYWERLGREAVRARLGNLRSWNLTPQEWSRQSYPVASLDQVQLGFENVSSEYQNHLSSFWLADSSWQRNVFEFAKGTAENGLYDSLDMQLATLQTTDLEDGRDLTVPILAVRAEPRPQLSFGVGGFGSTLLGPTLDLQGRFRYINQFEYDISTQVMYGEYRKGIVPTVALRRIYGGSLSFIGSAEIEARNFEPFFDRLPSQMVPVHQLWEEVRRDIVLGVLWAPRVDWELNTTVRIGNDDFRSNLSRVLFENGMRSDSWAHVNSLNGIIELRTPEVDSMRWFEVGDEIRWKALAGFHSVSLQSTEKGSAPLYGHYELGWKFSKSLNPIVQWNFNLHAGIQGRFNSKMHWLYPDSLDLVSGGGYCDYSLTNRFRIRTEGTPFSTLLPLPEFSSNHFASVATSLGLQYHGDGIWLYGMYLQDYSGILEDGLANRRVTVEPIVRWHWRSLDLFVGFHQTVAVDSLENFGKASRWTGIFQLGLVSF